jgi:hypothetical protein
MNRKRLAIALALGCLLILGAAPAAAAAPTATVLATGLAGGAGSAIGPDGALYVAEMAAGRIARVDPRTGAVAAFASGLPRLIPEVGFGGPVDVAFIGATAYALVTLVGEDVGGSDVVGIYRVDGPDKFTVVADLGAFSLANPPRTDFFVPSGVHYALEPFPGGFLVTDGHHNRVLHATPTGAVREVIAFGNIVPTGLAVAGSRVYLAQAGPVPHLPQDGKVVAFEFASPAGATVASGAPLLVDVALGRGSQVFALSQGEGVPTDPEGSPAKPNTGALVLADGRGGFTHVYGVLDRPTSLEIVGDTAYVVTLAGTVVKIEGLPGPPAPPATGSGGNLPGLPNTGAGGGADRLPLVAWLVLAAGGALVGGAGLLRRRARRA